MVAWGPNRIHSSRKEGPHNRGHQFEEDGQRERVLSVRPGMALSPRVEQQVSRLLLLVNGLFGS